MSGNAFDVGLAHEGLVTAATLRAARRARDVLGQILKVPAGELDHFADRRNKLRIVVVLINPFAMGDLIRIVKACDFFVVLHRNVLFVNFDLVDVVERASVEQIRVRGLPGTASIVS